MPFRPRPICLNAKYLKWQISSLVSTMAPPQSLSPRLSRSLSHLVLQVKTWTWWSAAGTCQSPRHWHNMPIEVSSKIDLKLDMHIFIIIRGEQHLFICQLFLLYSALLSGLYVNTPCKQAHMCSYQPRVRVQRWHWRLWWHCMMTLMTIMKSA